VPGSKVTPSSMGVAAIWVMRRVISCSSPGNARPLQPLPVLLAAPDQIASLRIRRRDRLGGVLHEYQHAA
jgi:hypothetical protein